MKKFLQEFQTFISRGNVLDLAVAVIIGAAFSAIVNSLVKDLINPLLGFLVGKPDFTGLFIVLSEPAGYTGPRTYEALTAAGATVFGYGAFLTAVVHFLLLAFVIFWLIKVVTGLRVRLEALAKADKEKAKAKADKEKKPGVGKRIARFFRELRSELKKVSWPTRADTLKKTGIVIVCVIVVGIIVWIFDGIASSVIDALLSLFGQH